MDLAMPQEFDAAYFAANYRDYARQNPKRKLDFYRREVDQSLAPGVPRRIHDLGCAYGVFLGELGSNWERYGSDVSEYALDKAKARCPEARFQRASASDRNPFDVTFGVLTAFDVIEHVPDLEAVANSVQEQLLTGGSFVFVVPVYDGLSGPVIRVLDRDPTHVHKWPRQRWLDWAAEHFDVIRWTGIVRWLVPGGYYVHRVTQAFKRHTPAILVVCRQRSRA